MDANLTPFLVLKIKDGRRISIEFNVVLLKDAGGRVLGAAATSN